MSLALFVAHKSSNDKCPELSAGQFFTGAQIPSCIFADVWSIREEDVSYLPNHQREPSAGRVVVFSRQEAPATN